MADSAPETPTPAPRRRNVKAATSALEKPDDQVPANSGDEKPAKKKVGDEDDYSPWLDVARVLSFLFFASCALSYLISGGETFFWGMKNKPNYLKLDYWKTKLVWLHTHSPLLPRLNSLPTLVPTYPQLTTRLG
jgi:hypothetical protein